MHGLVSKPRPAGTAKTPDDMPQQHVDSGLDLRAVLNVLRRHLRLLTLTTAAVLGLAILITFQLQPQYTASALIVVDTRDSQILGFETGMSEGAGQGSVVDTEVEIARSKKVAERAADSIDVTGWPEFAERPSVVDILRSLVGLGSGVVSVQPVTELNAEAQARLIEALSNRVKVRRLGLTSVISISATAYDAARAAVIANAVADAYLTEQIAAKLESNERAASFLQTRVDRISDDVGTIERRIDDFVSQKLAELGSPEAKALLTTLNTEEQERRANSRMLDQLTTALQADDYLRLTQLVATQNADLAERRTALMTQLAATADEGRLLTARERLSALDAEIRRAASTQSSALQTEIALSHARSSTARNQISNALDRVELPQDVSLELFRLQREAETSRNLYQTYLTKLRAVEQQTDFNVPDSRVIATAAAPSDPSFPPRRLILAASLVLALGAGVGAAFLREYFVGGTLSVEQLEDITGLVVAGSIPRFPPDTPARADFAIVAHPLSAFSEGVRRVLLGIDAYSPRARCMFVTSALPGDGKTTTAMALARHAALIGRSTLLIDADLRHPAIHEFLGDKVEIGLIDFLAGRSGDVANAIKVVKEPETGAHFILGANASSIATDALLLSQRFSDLIAYARANYDLTIIDTPPVGLVVDATIVARHCDLGLFVVRYAATPLHAVRQSTRDLVRRVDVPVYGVLNDVDGADGAYYGYNKQYRAYYS